MLLARLNEWTLVDLPRMNIAILAGEMPREVLTRALTGTVLADLPRPGSFTPRAAQQALVLLGFAGASVARHYQEEDLARKQAPERAFDDVVVAADHVPFRDYFAQLADRTGTGHGPRDSFATVVRWNLPATEVRWSGEQLAMVPSAFDDGRIRTYTGDIGERLFFELIKKTEALELGVNLLLEPLAEDGVDLTGEDAVGRVRVAAGLLMGARGLSKEFGQARIGLAPGHFVDVFRQFAAHWEVGDIPPSGALDAESLKRDLLLGLDFPDRDAHIRRLYPGLLAAEREALERQMPRPPLPDTLLASLGLSPLAVDQMSVRALRDLVCRHPALVAWYQLLTAHARASAMHLALTKKYMFRLAREREMAGVPDVGVVPRTEGTTGMVESLLERLVRIRHNHVLAGLQHIPQLELLALAGLPQLPVPDTDALVRFVRPPVTLSVGMNTLSV